MDRSKHKRLNQLDKLIGEIERRVDAFSDSRGVWEQLGITQTKLNVLKLDPSLHRSRVFSKLVNDIIEVVTDNEFGNWYNWDRILKGKVKLFPGNSPKERMISVLEEAKTFYL